MGCGVAKNQDEVYFVVCDFNSAPKFGDDFNNNFPILTKKNIENAKTQYNEAQKLQKKLQEKAPPMKESPPGELYIGYKAIPEINYPLKPEKRKCIFTRCFS